MIRFNEFINSVNEEGRSLIRLILLALTSLYCIFPLLTHGGLPYNPDMSFHIFQADHFDKAIRDGIIYPRWILDSNSGYGSPSFIFYSPLSYYFVSAIHFLVPSLILSMIIAIWCSFLLSGVTMLMTITKMFGKSAGLLAAIIYQILPFHLIDLYNRGAFAELFAFIWFPLIIFFMIDLFESGKRTALIGLSISYAGLILTHLVSGFIFTIMIGTYILYNYFFKSKKSAMKIVISLVLGLGLSSFYLLPVTMERKFIQIDYIKNHIFGNYFGGYKENFLFMPDMFTGKLLYSYLSLHICVMLEVLLFLFLLLWMKENRHGLTGRSRQHFLSLLFLFSLFLTTPLSMPLWRVIPGFPYIQFPWRWWSVMEVSLCFLFGGIFSSSNIPSLKSAAFSERAVIYLLLTFFALSIVTIFRTELSPDYPPERALAAREYTPVWADLEKMIPGERPEKVLVVEGSAVTEITEWKSEKRIIGIKAYTPSILRIRTLYYPGWEADLDGAKEPINIEEGSGAMLIDILPGEHTLVLKFVDTATRFYAKLVSLGCVFVIALLVISRRFYLRHQHH